MVWQYTITDIGYLYSYHVMKKKQLYLIIIQMVHTLIFTVYILILFYYISLIRIDSIKFRKVYQIKSVVILINWRQFSLLFSVFLGNRNCRGFGFEVAKSGILCFCTGCFKGMKKLILLQLDHVDLTRDYKCFFNDLRRAHWKGFTFNNIPDDFY